ncbi:hypothetical protein ABT115_19310 [Streptomyces sp. NPDC001832]|uniref:hypothetical protein n=1 Tax=Streptomyces sp. NPDC001832 TaxID=3154527 RepID=UPI003333906E
MSDMIQQGYPPLLRSTSKRGTAVIRRKVGRSTAAWAAGAALLLQTGCGSDDSKSTALSAKQVEAALPGGAAMPGWTVSEEPEAIPMNSMHKQLVCPNEGNKGCEDARFYGLSTFHRDDKNANAYFQMAAYKDEQTAETAYEALWKINSRGPGPKAKNLDLGALGEESNARVGTVDFRGEPGAVAQVRVGTTLLWVQVTGTRKGDIDDALVKDMASLFSVRAEQAQKGDRPSATLGS